MATGRPSLFVPEIKQAIVQRLMLGVSLADAAAFAGVGESTVKEWIAIGNAHTEGRDHRRMPRLIEDRESYAAFAAEYKKAQMAQRQGAVTTIIRAGRDTWIHHKTGTIRSSPPPSFTWLDEETGELYFEDVTALYPNARIKRDWSGDVWTYQPGTWQASAWYLERTDPENWARRQYLLHGVDPKQIEKLAALAAEQNIPLEDVFEAMINRLGREKQKQDADR